MRRAAPIEIAHIISGLGLGGAETMLYKLLQTMDATDFRQRVVSLTDQGVMGARIQALGIPVLALGMRRGVPNPLAVVRLARWLRRLRPGLVQTWMYHADLIGGLAARLAGHPPLVWNLRQSNLDPAASKRSTRLAAGLCARLSHRLPDRILGCSESALRLHRRLGYRGDIMRFIPNGFDTQRFRPDPTAGASLRAQLGIAPDTPVIGMVGRFDPQKDHRNFLRAAAQMRSRHPDCRLLLCGSGVSWENTTLTGWIDHYALRRHLYLLGPWDDMPCLYRTLDILVLSSAFGEGFPNVIGEAMSCGIPCVVTDVGDCADIVGATGRVVPTRDPAALADAIASLLQQPAEKRAALGQAARRRIETHYAIAVIAERYEALYRELTAHPQK